MQGHQCDAGQTVDFEGKVSADRNPPMQRSPLQLHVFPESVPAAGPAECELSLYCMHDFGVIDAWPPYCAPIHSLILMAILRVLRGRDKVLIAVLKTPRQGAILRLQMIIAALRWVLDFPASAMISWGSAE
ncbi:hypothetical protein ANCCEY_05017 [Ancylostoma ceylanicum]|uniref:Uncharacterized protein n=1 Tax=Ancylostoma ceylanicum TaxID=53326 RepID=A0A0D6M7S1_9BILA|nr:hypothetical protein ANCCEY_05017 [Ancylostoma ceylanicum]